MPNGGSDCCGECAFNAHLGQQELHGYCVIRQLDVPNPFWTYCFNHPRRNPRLVGIPVGPVTVDAGTHPYARVEWEPAPRTKSVLQGTALLAMALLPAGGRAPSPIERRALDQLFEFEMFWMLDLVADLAFTEGVHRTTAERAAEGLLGWSREHPSRLDEELNRLENRGADASARQIRAYIDAQASTQED